MSLSVTPILFATAVAGSVAFAAEPAVPLVAEPFPLNAVHLTGGPFATAQDANDSYLLSLEPDRLLAGFRTNAGLEPRAAKYGGWEARGLAGHTLGHYLTALAWRAESVGDTDPRFREKLDYTIAELAACQTDARGGLISAIPEDERIFAELAAGTINVNRFGLNGGWVPWYNLHKLFAGLRDAYVHGGNADALTVLTRLADWAERTTAPLSAEQFQRMLYAEHGGMNEVLADLYALTDEPRYLALAQRFCDAEIIDPLARAEDRLDGYHANTQIPKLIGAARLYQLTGDKELGDAAHFFWDTVVDHRTWVIGGNSEAEHFFPPEQNERRLTASTAETCNTHNMLRLTEELWALQPTADRFDYFERALYNHILASVDPSTGHCTYFMSLRPGFFKYYGDPENAFWCCTGTGLENHTKYARDIYARGTDADDPTLYVNLFIPSRLDWNEAGVHLTQTTEFPAADTTRLTFTTSSPRAFTLKIRRPAWLAADATLSLNGEPLTPPLGDDGYWQIARTWHDDDTLALTLPMALRTEDLPHAADTFALLYGPIVLAGRLGDAALAGIDLNPPGENEYRSYAPPPAPGIVAPTDADVLASVQPVAGQPLTWRTNDLVQPADLELIPFYALHHENHVVYWTRFTPDAWQTEKAARATAAAAEAALSARTVDLIIGGEQQFEVTHDFRSERDTWSLHFAQPARGARAGGWFEYTIAVPADSAATTLRLTWWGNDRNRRALITLDGEPLADVTVDRPTPDATYETDLPVPAALVAGKSRVTVRIAAPADADTPQLLSLRVLRP